MAGIKYLEPPPKTKTKNTKRNLEVKHYTCKWQTSQRRNLKRNAKLFWNKQKEIATYQNLWGGCSGSSAYREN